jgi:hypothetical protein
MGWMRGSMTIKLSRPGRESVKPRVGFSILLFEQRVTGPQSALDLQIVTVRIGYMETAGCWQGPGI